MRKLTEEQVSNAIGIGRGLLARPLPQHELGSGIVFLSTVSHHVPLSVPAITARPAFGTPKSQSPWPSGLVLTRDSSKRLNSIVVRTRCWSKAQPMVQAEEQIGLLMAQIGRAA